MDPAEYFGWERHLAEVPPDFMYLRSIVMVMASIWADLRTFLTGKPHNPVDIAPILNTGTESDAQDAAAKTQEEEEEEEVRELLAMLPHVSRG